MTFARRKAAVMRAAQSFDLPGSQGARPAARSGSRPGAGPSPSPAPRPAPAPAVDGLLITHPADVRYLCGFTGSNGVLAFAGSKAVLFTDGRYTSQAREEATGTRVVIAAKSAVREACAWLEKAGVRRCGYDAAHTTVAALEAMRSAIGGRLRRGFFKALYQPVARQREVKDADEMDRMREAALLGCRLYEHILGFMDAGVSERAVAAELEYAARLRGADGMSFETIVASGTRSSLPHGHATEARLPRRGFVTLDFGVILNGYCSDMTRTIYMGKASQTEREAYDAVLEAQEAAVERVAPGVTCEEVDEAARSVLRRVKIKGTGVRATGLDKYFTHSTGHGVGLEIHEGPRLARGQKQKLEPGMVITIEPGVYLAGKFGIRIEDMVAVTATGHSVLTPSPKAWTTL